MKTLFVDYAAHAATKLTAEAERNTPVAEGLPDAGAQMAVGESATVSETDDVALSVVKVDDDEYEFVYKHRATGNVVLRRIESKEGARLHDMDPFFWTVLLNNGPAIEQQLQGINGGRYGFRVDHLTRTVHFKLDS